MNTGTMRYSAGLVAAAVLAAAVAAAPGVASAQQDLADRVHELEQELNLLRRLLESQMQANREAAEAAAEAASMAAEEADGPTLEMKGPAPTFSSADGDFTMAVTGRVHWDVGVYDERKPDHLNLNNGSNLRRARLGVKGKIMKHWGYEIVLDGGDSAADDVDIDTAFVSYNGLKPVTLTFGQHKAPLNLEDATSSNDIPFIERSLATNLFVGPAGGKRMGLSAIAHGNFWWAGAGMFGEKLGVDAGTGVDEQLAYVGRLAFAPLKTGEHGLHVGVSGWLLPEPQEDFIEKIGPTAPREDGDCRYRDRPEFRVDANRHIDARGSRVESCSGYGLELAGWARPIWVAGQYAGFGYDMEGDGNEDFDAWYVQAGWVVTGEGRPYSMRKAGWSGVKPASPFEVGGAGMGALELVARYSHADLGDIGGEETNYTFGANWWLNDWVAVKLNYIRADATTNGGEEREFDIFGMRAQVKW